MRDRRAVHVADLSVPDDVAEPERMIAATDVGMLVNNAGFGGYDRFVGIEPDLVAELIGVHILAVSRLTRAALPAMIARGSGTIINVVSLLAFSGNLPPQPWPYRATYAGGQGLPGRVYPSPGRRAGRQRRTGPGVLPRPGGHRVPRPARP